LLGPTSYGLVGFYATLTLFLIFLDQAVSPTFSREIARSANQRDANAIQRLFRTLEIVSGGMAVTLGALVSLGAPLIAGEWLPNSGLPKSELIDAIRMMGLSLAFSWPSALYSSGFVGLQRQDLLARVRIVVATLQSVGAVVVLAKISASPLAFFAWMAITSAVMSIALRMCLVRTMTPATQPPRVDINVLRGIWRFAAGNLLIGLTTSLLTQSSGLLVAKYCTLDQLAAYTLAVTLAAQVSTILVQPVSATLMPHFARLLTQDDQDFLAREYHRWTQIFAALILPITGTFVVFGRPLLQLWLGMTSPLVDPVAALLPWIAIGTLFNTLMTPPYFLQIASGWTRLSVVKNIIAVAAVLPVLFIFVPRYGPIAAAVVWIAINVGYYLFEVPLMHRRLLRRELWRWWIIDTLLPTIVVTLIYAVAAVMLPPEISRLPGVLLAFVMAAVAWLVLLMAWPALRATTAHTIGLMKQRIFRIN
jgi:O-antigen/teichoic acid export membrane protein